MRQFIVVCIFVIVLLVGHSVFAEPLDRADYLGDWELVYVSEVDIWATVLRIEEDRFLLCETPECADPVVGDRIELVGDFIYLTLESDAVPELRLILGGYKTDVKSALFGTRFHYQQGSIISGLPMVYSKVGLQEK